jgi:DNA polymerase-3 subunit epsilon
MQMARAVWNVRPTTLPDVCRFLGIALNHHDALSDAEACARIMIAAKRRLATPAPTPKG